MSRRSLLGRQTAAPPAGLVADLVSGMIHGYSTARKLRSAYTGNCLTVRNADVSAGLTDVGFLNNLLNESQIPSLTNVGITTKYDQIGSRNMNYNGNLFHMPLIKAGGTIVKVSGKPYAQYDGTDDFLATSSTTPITDKDCTVFVVFESQASNSIQDIFNETEGLASSKDTRITSDTRTTVFRHSVVRNTSSNVSDLVFVSQQPQTTKRVFIFRRTGTSIEAYDQTGVLIDSTVFNHTYSNMALSLGYLRDGNINYFSGKIAELLINNTALSTTDRNTVLDNIKDFYSIT